ncbi:cornifelin-like [Protopterus annectens]|uniref:cornifelin-like n=1 Tax=Protopterus annectens TaxID=7888 RepID=UPI001CF97F4C|nr:cornifelin-like [Protopterus annectens]
MAQTVTSQPTSIAVVGTNQWSTGVVSCCADLPICVLGTFCPLILGCYAADRYGENPLLAVVPGGMTAMRTHMRLSYGIEGTLCNDALMVCCCHVCEVCRMAREVRIQTRASH